MKKGIKIINALVAGIDGKSAIESDSLHTCGNKMIWKKQGVNAYLYCMKCNIWTSKINKDKLFCKEVATIPFQNDR